MEKCNECPWLNKVHRDDNHCMRNDKIIRLSHSVDFEALKCAECIENKWFADKKEDVLKEKIQGVVKKHTAILNILKDNGSRWDEEHWTDAEMHLNQSLITTLASVLSDINRVLRDEK